MTKAPHNRPVHVIGVVSDTHGLVRPEVVDVLSGVEIILHAGDIGKPEVLASLQRIAPVVALRGNMDRGSWAENLSQTEVVDFDGVLLYVLHDMSRLDLDPVAAGFRAVISGHSHRPLVKRQNGVLYLNPGSAGPRRFTYPVSLALLHLEGGTLEARFVKPKPRVR
jgi:putative phosphoesterase